MKHLLLILFFLRLDAADVIFSRRVYTPKGRSYQQLWSLDTKTRATRALTSTDRRHVQPVCSPDGSVVWFLSGPFGSTGADSELWRFRPSAATEKLVTKLESPSARLLGGTAERVFFAADDGLYRWDGKVTRLASLALPHAPLSPDGQSFASQAPDRDTVTMLSTSGVAGRVIPRCTAPVWFADGRKLACTDGAAIRVIDLATGIDRVKLTFNQRNTPPFVQDVSPSGAHLLVGTLGANHSSGSPQSDYWVVDVAGKQWQYVGPGQSAIFAPAGGVILQSPRELSKVGAGKNWVSGLLLFDPATKAQTPLAPPDTSNMDPFRCGLPLRRSTPRRAVK